MAEKSLIQSIFHFPQKKQIDDFILSNANHQAFLYISKWPKWYGNNCVISGPTGSGKSYLANYWGAYSNAHNIELFTSTKAQLNADLERYPAFIIDDINKYFSYKYLLPNLDKHDFDNFSETFMQIFDFCKAEDKYLLITSNEKAENLNIKLPDLKSRIINANHFALDEPDESTMRTLLIKLFSDYQLKISSEVINYISKNIANSLTEIHNLVLKIERLSLSEKRNITIPFIKEILNA